MMQCASGGGSGGGRGEEGEDKGVRHSLYVTSVRDAEGRVRVCVSDAPLTRLLPLTHPGV
jgi:hypothetical protein